MASTIDDIKSSSNGISSISINSLTNSNSNNNNTEGRYLSQSHPLQLVYNNLSYTIPIKGKDKSITYKPILKSISGVFEPGRFTAVLGASGAGKTSLLNVLAGRPSKGVITGDIRVNNNRLTSMEMKKLSAFVHQEDIILDTMTVREALTMSALLRLPKSIPKQEKLARVEEVIDLLHLRKCSDSTIGSALHKGISGGERRRVSLGIEMITNPGILFLDEPTSGLDTFTAHSVCELLSTVAHQQGRTVIATIHQPSSEIFHMFDDLLLLSDGEVLYSGPAASVVEYFSSLGYNCPEYTNPADYIFMHILNNSEFIDSNIDGDDLDNPTIDTIEAGKLLLNQLKQKELDNTQRLTGLLANWKDSTNSTKLNQLIQNPQSGPLPTQSQLQRGDSGFALQFQLLAKRAWRNLLRNKFLIRARFGQSIFFGLLLGLIYIQLAGDQKSIQDRAGSLFFMVVSSIFQSTFAILNVFYVEKTVFIREYGSGMYSTPAYFLSRVFVELPFKVIIPLMQSAILYFLMGYQLVASKYLIYFITIMLLENCGSGLGIMLSTFFDDIQVAMIMTPLLLMPLMIFSGLYINLDSIPVYFRWMGYCIGEDTLVARFLPGSTTLIESIPAKSIKVNDYLVDENGKPIRVIITPIYSIAPLHTVTPVRDRFKPYTVTSDHRLSLKWGGSPFAQDGGVPGRGGVVMLRYYKPIFTTGADGVTTVKDIQSAGDIIVAYKEAGKRNKVQSSIYANARAKAQEVVDKINATDGYQGSSTDPNLGQDWNTQSNKASHESYIEDSYEAAYDKAWELYAAIPTNQVLEFGETFEMRVSDYLAANQKTKALTYLYKQFDGMDHFNAASTKVEYRMKSPFTVSTTLSKPSAFVGITVESDRGLFCLADGQVTGNCSPMKWGFVAVSRNEFTGLELYCKSGEYSRSGQCAYTKGEQVLDLLSVSNEPGIPETLFILLGMGIGFLGLALFALDRRAKRIQ